MKKINIKFNKNNIQISKQDVLRFVFDALTILLGTFVMAFGFSVFLRPNNIVPSGFMGLAQTIHDLLAKVGFTYFSISIWYLILNAFLFIFAIKLLGFRFGLRAGIGIAAYSIFVEVLKEAGFIQTIINKFADEVATIGEGSLILFAIYGGISLGVGIGLVFRANGSTGGCDMLALVFRKIFPNITTGQWVIIIDTLVLVLSVIAYQSFILPLYALIAIFLTGKVSDLFIDGVKSLRAYYILTEKKDELSEKFMNILHHGLTNIKGEGMFTHKEKNILLVMITRSQVNELKNIVKETDPNAFMFCSSVKEAYGIGFEKMSTIRPSKLSKFWKNNSNENKQNSEKKENKTQKVDSEIAENKDNKNQKE